MSNSHPRSRQTIAVTRIANQQTVELRHRLAFQTYQVSLFIAGITVYSLADEHRRIMARLAKLAGFQTVIGDGCMVCMQTLRRWFRQYFGDLPTENESKLDADMGQEIMALPATPHHGGTPRTPAEIEKLVITFANDNSQGDDSFGISRITDLLLYLDLPITRTTVREILRRHGIPIAPLRGRATNHPQVIVTVDDDDDGVKNESEPVPASSDQKKSSRPKSTRDHVPDVVAIDFLVTPMLTKAYTMTYAIVLVAIHQPTRTTTILGQRHLVRGAISTEFMDGCADRLLGFMRSSGCAHVLMDNDSLYYQSFKSKLTDGGATIATTDVHCPWQNGFIERMVQTLKRGILRKALPVGEQALRILLESYLLYYHEARPHQGLGGRRVVEPSSGGESPQGTITHVPMALGLCSHYQRLPMEVGMMDTSATPRQPDMPASSGEVKHGIRSTVEPRFFDEL